MADPLQIVFCLLGTFFFVCSFTDVKKNAKAATLKIKKMKFDPDWINFILGAVLFAFGAVSFLVLSAELLKFFFEI